MATAAAEGGEEDPRWRRSSTDCVLFLAARFACTKGLNCEYRHCEGARFNRRNCWYWFQGNCFNPSCTFRHPPLESFNRTKPLSDPLPPNASASIKEANPCYFYYNSYCKKGDSCPFLHEPRTCNDVVGICSEATTSNLAVNGNSAGDEMIESSKDALANPCQGNPDHIKKHHSERFSVSSSPEFNGAISNAPETSFDAVGYMKSSRLSDQSSGDSEVEHAEQDECSDSSSGFDVLVDGVSNKIDLEHQLARERDPEVLHGKYYNGDPVVYGLNYHDAEYHEQELCGFDDSRGCYVDYLEGVQGPDCVPALGDIPHDRMLVKSTSEECDERFFYPRNLMGSDAGFDHQRTQVGRISKRRPDKRKGAKGRNGRIKRCHVHEPRNGSEGIETRPTHGMQYSLIDDCSRSLACATFRGEKKRTRRKQQHVRSAKLSKYATSNAKLLDYPEDFTGPKTLAQIKEEKCRSKSSFSHSAVHAPHGRSFSNDFEGPKSLSELLKAKGRTSIDEGIMM